MDLTTLAPYPAPWPLPDGYERHAPTVPQTTQALWSLLRHRDWSALPWPELLEGLLAAGRTDIPLARLLEGHVDALRIHAEAGTSPHPDCLYAVWASRSHATGVAARPDGDDLLLSGTLRFASGAGLVDRALVPVWLDEHDHVLLDLPVRGWPVDESWWRTPAMAASRTHTIPLEGATAPRRAQVGGHGFYLGRHGFFIGGVGVAAVWAGGAARLVDLAADYVRDAPPSAVRAGQLGRVRTELAAAHALLATAGCVLGSGVPRLCSDPPGGPEQRAATESPRDVDPRALATEIRAGVAGAVRRVVAELRDLAGPAGLAHQHNLTRALEDLDLYVRQQNPYADAEYLGELPG